MTDNPIYALSIEIDGHAKKVEDYVGSWEGMPAVVTELEEEVDTFGRTAAMDRWQRWVVQALQDEKFNFKNFEAQVMLKEAASRGTTATVRELLEAGVPLEPMPAPKPKEPYKAFPLRPWDGSMQPAAIRRRYRSSSTRGRARAIRPIRTWLWWAPLVQEMSRP